MWHILSHSLDSWSLPDIIVLLPGQPPPPGTKWPNCFIISSCKGLQLCCGPPPGLLGPIQSSNKTFTVQSLSATNQAKAGKYLLALHLAHISMVGRSNTPPWCTVHIYGYRTKWQKIPPLYEQFACCCRRNQVYCVKKRNKLPFFLLTFRMWSHRNYKVNPRKQYTQNVKWSLLTDVRRSTRSRNI